MTANGAKANSSRPMGHNNDKTAQPTGYLPAGYGARTWAGHRIHAFWLFVKKFTFDSHTYAGTVVNIIDSNGCWPVKAKLSVA